MPAKFVVKKGTTGKFRFVLMSPNGQVVATSQAYGSKASAMGGIRSVKKVAADAPIEDETKPAPKAAAKKMPAKKMPAKKMAAKKMPAMDMPSGGM